MPGKPPPWPRAPGTQFVAPPPPCHPTTEKARPPLSHPLREDQPPSGLISSNNKIVSGAVKTSRIWLYWRREKLWKKKILFHLKGKKDLHYSHASVCHFFHHFLLESPSLAKATVISASGQ